MTALPREHTTTTGQERRVLQQRPRGLVEMLCATVRAGRVHVCCCPPRESTIDCLGILLRAGPVVKEPNDRCATLLLQRVPPERPVGLAGLLRSARNSARAKPACRWRAATRSSTTVQGTRFRIRHRYLVCTVRRRRFGPRTTSSWPKPTGNHPYLHVSRPSRMLTAGPHPCCKSPHMTMALRGA